MGKLITLKSLMDEKIRNQKVYPIQVFKGDKDFNLNTTDSEPEFNKKMKITTPVWEDSEPFYKTWNRIHEIRGKYKTSQGDKMNAAQAPSAAEIIALIGEYMIDVTRRAVESPDLTSQIAREITDLNFQKSVSLTNFLPYRGEFMGIEGANDSVPLIEQHTGEKDSVELMIAGLGWRTVLANLLWNPIHNLQKVSQAVADAYTDLRNAVTIGQIVATTFHASQIQQPVVITGATYDINLYNTILGGVRLVRSLLDIQTARKISTSRGIKLLCNSNDAWTIERVIFGQLTNGGANGMLITQNAQALPIDAIIAYDQGINNGFEYGKKVMSYPGVEEGEIYLFVPYDYFTILTKRGLTMETGPGNVLQLSQEERAWYTAGGWYAKPFFGSSDSSIDGDEYPGYGAIVKVELPPAPDVT